MHHHNPETFATVPLSTGTAWANPLHGYTTKYHKLRFEEVPPTKPADCSIPSPSEFATSLRQGSMPISVSDPNMAYSTVVITDRALKRMDCLVYRDNDAAARFFSTTITPSTPTVRALTAELQEVRARLESAETTEAIRVRYELPSRTLMALDGYILSTALTTQQKSELFRVGVYSFTTARELRGQ